jgi:protein subunit release factor A
MSFAIAIYDDAKRLFPEGEVQVLIARAPGASSGKLLPEVRLVHLPSGLEVICHEFPTQTENYIAAAMRLRAACDRLGR